jgi:MOSC domain-containing protein YiiM
VARRGKTVYTGVWKHPVDGPAMVRRLNIDGGQGDTTGHGGEQRAVLVCQVHVRRLSPTLSLVYATTLPL